MLVVLSLFAISDFLGVAISEVSGSIPGRFYLAYNLYIIYITHIL